MDWQALFTALEEQTMAKLEPAFLVDIQNAVDNVVFPVLQQQFSQAGVFWGLVGNMVGSLQQPVDAYLQGLLTKVQAANAQAKKQ